jgi:hypothetical protein
MLEAARSLPAEPMAAQYSLDENVSWAVRIDPYARSFTQDEKTKLILDLGFLGFKGKVKVLVLSYCFYIM